jgi:CO/xanthine dehydrogenase Mo-binding subunit
MVKAFATKYPRMLFEIIIRSSIASGRVTRPDLHQARGVAGIKAVIAPAGKPIDRFAY